MVRCYLGLGSNLTTDLGTPKQHIESAVAQLNDHPDVSHVRCSSLYLSKPMGPQDQPDFVNAVVELKTLLSPLALLALCQQLEMQAQRQRLRHWGERSLDVDLLLYGEQHLSSPTLTVPHAGLFERNFVLIPLIELNPDLTVAERHIKHSLMSKDWTGLALLS